MLGIIFEKSLLIIDRLSRSVELKLALEFIDNRCDDVVERQFLDPIVFSDGG